MHPSLFSSIREKQSSVTNDVTVYPLDSLSVFEAKGPDTLSFLQGQVTNDIVAPGSGQSRLAGYCTAQGRLLATMILGEVPSEDGVTVVRGMIRSDILAPVLKRLGMFVLRAKVKLSETEFGVVGVRATDAGRQTLEAAFQHALPKDPWQTVHTDSGTWIAAPCAESTISRWWWVAGEHHLSKLEATPTCWGYGQANNWDAADIQSGLPWIEARTQDLFIPQTLNLDLIGGVSFTKGCYPGQEIVARSHYRGTVKKRMALGKIQGPDGLELYPGGDIFDATQPEQPCGRMISVATITSEDLVEYWVLFETTFDAFDRQQLRVKDGSGPLLSTIALPYSTRPDAK